MLKRSVHSVSHGTWFSLLSVALSLLALAIVSVKSQAIDSALLGTFRTQNLIVDEQVQVGPSAPANRHTMQIANVDPTNETQLWIVDTSIGHVGTLANQAINLVLRGTQVMDTAAGPVNATNIDAAVTATKTGVNNLISTAVLANASGDCASSNTCYSFRSTNGQMIQTDPAHFGAVDTTSLTNSGSTTTTGLVNGANTTLGTSGVGNTTTVNGTLDERTSNADAYISIRSTASGGRQYFLESSATAGTVPNSFNIYDGTAGAARFAITSNGAMAAYEHVLNRGGVPTIGTCGSGTRNASSTDTAGVFTTDAAVTTCTITFARTWTNRPSCVLYGEGTATPPTCTISATAITCSVVGTSTTYNWHCIGLSNSQ
jgi:hypothetical protein